MKIIYQLQAVGIRAFFNEKGRISSKTVYGSRSQAEIHMEKFKASCCGDGIYDFTPETTVVNIIELELAEDDDL